MHRREDQGMFSQCFCDLIDAIVRVAETLWQHLSLLDSNNKKKKQRQESVD